MLPVPVVGVIRTPGPLSAQFFKEFSSSVLSSGIGSCSKGSGWEAGGVTNSGLVVGAGVVLGPAPGIPTCFGWDPVGWRRARNSFNIFSILRP